MHLYPDIDGVLLIAPSEELDFIHRDDAIVDEQITAFEAYTQMTDNTSGLLRVSFWIRDVISRFAGVKAINGFERARPERPPQEGEKLDFFTLHRCSDDELYLLASDHHLSVLVALTLSFNKSGQRKLTLTTSVKTYNFFGKLYMLPVAPAHGVIVRSMLSKVRI